MKFKYRTKHEKFLDKVRQKCVWHEWFAWRPVIVEESGALVRVWLERIGRRCAVHEVRSGNYDTKYTITGIYGTEYCTKDKLMINKLANEDILDKTNGKYLDEI